MSENKLTEWSILRSARNGRSRHINFLLAPLFGIGMATVAVAQQAIPAEANPSNVAPSWPSLPQAPKNAPNILLIMTDDVGFAASGSFGGPVPTATFDALGKSGIRFNRFNTTALCSPTRASLLTGRTPHNAGMGNVTNIPTGYEGYTSIIPKSAGTVAEVLKENGFNTAMFGKAHITPEWEMSQAGPFDRWPTGLGFEYFYGFLSADTNQWAPSLVENTRPVEPPHNDPNYFFDRDIADRARAWIKEQHALAPQKPFFLYFAPAAAHAPHHAPREWLARFRNKFNMGWDKLREEIYARQKANGTIPHDSKLTPRPSSLPAWASLTADQKRIASRLTEAYVASLAYADEQIGRVIDAVRESGELENTLIIYIQGDNGAAAEGGLNGTLFEQSMVNRQIEDPAFVLSKIDDIGGPAAYNAYPAGWAWALNTPFPYYKQIASQFGGIRNGLAMSWPKHMTEPGRVRQQYAHVSDIMPTILEAAGIAPPNTLGGVKQKPLDGISLAYSFTSPSAPSARRTQVFEMMENFGIYHDGWFAGVLPKRDPWAVYGDIGSRDLDPSQRHWQLFNIDRDFSQSSDLAILHPLKLHEMQDLFWKEAARTNILPIHLGQGAAGRPSLNNGRTFFTYLPGMMRIPEDNAPHIIGRAFSIDARITVPPEGARGVVVAQGGRFSGYSLYLRDGVPTFAYNAVPPAISIVRANEIVPVGDHLLSASFAPWSTEPGAGGSLTLKIDGRTVASGRIERTLPTWISFAEGLDVGRDNITAVAPDYTPETSAFSGTIIDVQFDIDQK